MRSPGRTGALVAALLACASGCGERERERPPSTTAPPTTSTTTVPEGSHEVREADPRLPPAQLGPLEGTVTIDAVTGVTGASVEAGQVVALAGPGRATMDLPGGARSTLWSEGAMSMAVAPDRGVWISRGVAHLTDPPAGLGGRTPMRVATPTATIELQGAGDVVVAVDATGATTVTVLNGIVEITGSEVDQRHRLRVAEVVAGLEARVVDHVEEPVQGAARLDDALTAARERVMAPPSTEAGAPTPPTFAATTSRLDEAMRWLEVEERRGRDLTARHRAAVQAGQTDEAFQYQREIVAHAQSVHALRQVVLARWERFALTARAGGDARVAAEEVAPRLDRLRNLLGS
ncbi:MAG: hypothetical protein U0353_26615 [Sandaracinus sp.]